MRLECRRGLEISCESSEIDKWTEWKEDGIFSKHSELEKRVPR